MKNLSKNILVATLAVLQISCEKDNKKYLEENINSIFNLTSEKGNTDADGKSSILITAILQKKSDIKRVYFKTSHGTFLENGKDTLSTEAILQAGSLSATASLVPNLEVIDKVTVNATIAQLKQTTTLAFVQAFPDSLQVESAIASISKGYGSEVPITAKLIRHTGLPSQHQFVQFISIDENGKNIGEFRGISSSGSNNEGIVNSIFVLKDTTYIGKVRIIGIAQSKNKIIPDTLTVFITK